MMKRVFFVVVAFLVAAAVFAGGNQETQSGEKSAAATEVKEQAVKTVRMWTFLNPEGATSGRNLALKKIIDQFEAENPGIDVVVETPAMGHNDE